MKARNATPADAAAIAALGGATFAARSYAALPHTRLLVWENAVGVRAFAAFSWGERGEPLVLNGLGPEAHGREVVTTLLALAARHGRTGLLAAAPERDDASRRLFTSVPCRTRLRRAVGPGEDDIEYFVNCPTT